MLKLERCCLEHQVAHWASAKHCPVQSLGLGNSNTRNSLSTDLVNASAGTFRWRRTSKGTPRSGRRMHIITMISFVCFTMLVFCLLLCCCCFCCRCCFCVCDCRVQAACVCLALALQFIRLHVEVGALLLGTSGCALGQCQINPGGAASKPAASLQRPARATYYDFLVAFAIVLSRLHVCADVSGCMLWKIRSRIGWFQTLPSSTAWPGKQQHQRSKINKLDKHRRRYASANKKKAEFPRGDGRSGQPTLFTHPGESRLWA